MKAFIWTIVILLVLEAIGKISLIVKQDFMRNPVAMAIDVFVSICFIGWGSFLLGGASGH